MPRPDGRMGFDIRRICELGPREEGRDPKRLLGAGNVGASPRHIHPAPLRFCGIAVLLRPCSGHVRRRALRCGDACRFLQGEVWRLLRRLCASPRCCLLAPERIGRPLPASAACRARAKRVNCGSGAGLRRDQRAPSSMVDVDWWRPHFGGWHGFSCPRRRGAVASRQLGALSCGAHNTVEHLPDDVGPDVDKKVARTSVVGSSQVLCHGEFIL